MLASRVMVTLGDNGQQQKNDEYTFSEQSTHTLFDSSFESFLTS
jgi:hypothetical protein